MPDYVDDLTEDITQALIVYLTSTYGMTVNTARSAILAYNLPQKIRDTPSMYKHYTLEQIADRVLGI